MTIRLSDLSGSGGLPKLAPDLTYADDFQSGSSARFINLTLTPATYEVALSLTGKFAVSSLAIFGATVEFWNFRLTVDGVIIWDGGQTPSSGNIYLYGGQNGTDIPFTCNSSLLLEVRSTADTSISLNYIARPIL